MEADGDADAPSGDALRGPSRKSKRTQLTTTVLAAESAVNELRQQRKEVGSMFLDKLQNLGQIYSRFKHC